MLRWRQSEAASVPRRRSAWCIEAGRRACQGDLITCRISMLITAASPPHPTVLQLHREEEAGGGGGGQHWTPSPCQTHPGSCSTKRRKQRSPGVMGWGEDAVLHLVRFLFYRGGDLFSGCSRCFSLDWTRGGKVLVCSHWSITSRLRLVNKRSPAARSLDTVLVSYGEACSHLRQRAGRHSVSVSSVMQELHPCWIL